MGGDLKERWSRLLSAHLLRGMSGQRVLGDTLLSFEGLTVIVRTKARHLVGDEFFLQDQERLIVVRRNPWKEFTPKWESITRIDFLYWKPPSAEIAGLLKGSRDA